MKVEEHVSRERSGPERQWKRYQHRVYRVSEEAGFAFHATFPFRVCLIGILWIRVDRATIASVAMATQICEVMNRARQFCSRRAHAVKVESACSAGRTIGLQKCGALACCQASAPLPSARAR